MGIAIVQMIYLDCSCRLGRNIQTMFATGEMEMLPPQYKIGGDIPQD